MAFRNRLIMGIAIACSLVLSNCAFPVRPGYDRKSGSYKRYRVPKKEVVEADTTTIDSQEELVQEEILAAASKNTGNNQANASDSVGSSTLDSTGKNVTPQTDSLALSDSSANKGTVAKKQKQDSTQVRNSDTTKVAVNATAKTVEKQTEKTTDKASAKKTDKAAKKQTKPAAKPTNLEKYAKEWLGAKYVYGAASKKKTDCSGYVMQVYKGFYGISLDHNAQHIYDDGRGYSIKRTKLQEGDLVFFGNFWKISHVGIYLKGNRFIHASTSKGVVITSMDDNYWSSKYKGARRFK
ncbi:C40 family peptidase [Fibrobacter sp. UWB12]|uniref:C40 family peptidase n=1 Tax=Fibrobacter sp. UWB12 TaxID=1896203 RepID=UPI00091B2650|nr:C40 family peptidase [Fibrobacter sp. UWB12]SHK42205.1 Cell wall-associated hydrolase, NlpC family [Fibrobacter sp. UWB12]